MAGALPDELLGGSLQAAHPWHEGAVSGLGGPRPRRLEQEQVMLERHHRRIPNPRPSRCMGVQLEWLQGAHTTMSYRAGSRRVSRTPENSDDAR